MDLTYEQVREIAEDGDIVFVHGSWKRPLQAAIMFLTRSEYSHCFIVFWVQTHTGRRLLVVEAQGGTKRRILNASFYENRTLSLVRAPKEWGTVEAAALASVGKKGYGYFDALYVGIRDFLWKALNIRIPSNDFPSEICSEFIARVYDLPQKNVSPQGLLEMLKNEA